MKLHVFLLLKLLDAQHTNDSSKDMGHKSVSLSVQVDALMCTWSQQAAGSGMKYQLRSYPRLNFSSYQPRLYIFSGLVILKGKCKHT